MRRRIILFSFFVTFIFATITGYAQGPTRCVTVRDLANHCPNIHLKVCINYSWCTCPESHCCIQNLMCQDIYEGQTYCFQLPEGAQIIDTWVYKVTFQGDNRIEEGPDVFDERPAQDQFPRSIVLCEGHALHFWQDENGEITIEPF